MKFGLREIADVVFRAKGVCRVGNRIFYKDEPIMYFDTLKTSSLEAASATVYAQGGKGNPRLVAWDGDRTLTFNMEDALISAEGLQILSGAGLTEASTGEPLRVHATTRVAGNKVVVRTTGSGSSAVTNVDIILPEIPYWAKAKTGETGDNIVTAKGITITKTWNDTDHKWDLTPSYVALQEYYNDENYIYIMALDEYGEVRTEPFIPDISKGIVAVKYNETTKVWDELTTTADLPQAQGYKVSLYSTDDLKRTDYAAGSYVDHGNTSIDGRAPRFGDDVYDIFVGGDRDAVLADYYVEKVVNAQQIEITADKFGGTYYIEGSTLFRTQQGLDMPAEFIIPNGKIQSNFTFSMAATGDPSTFTFTVDAMPDYTRFDKTKKVLAAIQVIEDGAVIDADRERTYTVADDIDFNRI
jgi:hypothetical protein